MTDRKTPQGPLSLDAEFVAQARDALADDEPAVLLAFENAHSGDTEEVLVLSEKTADDLASTLGYFGYAETVAIFAAASTCELTEADIVGLIGGDPEDVLAEIGRMEGGGFLIRREIDGIAWFSAGNPPLKRFFVNRFAPNRKKRF